jgi:surface polysaccharide O-acyltransferase-like enzyme
MGPTALIVNGQDSNAALHIMTSVGFVLFVATACFSAFALAFRFAAGRWPICDHISNNAYGIYFFHYPFVLWLQYLLLGLAFPAVVKGLAVLAATVILSWGASLLTSRILSWISLSFKQRAIVP